MKSLSLGRFALVHALVAGIIAAGLPSRALTSPAPQNGTVIGGTVIPSVIQLEDVLVNAVVTDFTMADLMRDLGVPVPVASTAALLATGDFPHIGFEVHVDGVPSGEIVHIVTLESVVLTTSQLEFVAERQDITLESNSTVVLASVVLAYGKAVKKALGVMVTLVTAPEHDRLRTSITTGFTALGEVVDLKVASSRPPLQGRRPWSPAAPVTAKPPSRHGRSRARCNTRHASRRLAVYSYLVFFSALWPVRQQPSGGLAAWASVWVVHCRTLASRSPRALRPPAHVRQARSQHLGCA